jgi:hypothetical protein
VDEREWLTTTDSQAMLRFLLTSGAVSDRKMRLFVATCARSMRPIFGDRQESLAVLLERYADGELSRDEFILLFHGDMSDALSPQGIISPTFTLVPIRHSVRRAAKAATDFTHPGPRENTEEEKARICNWVRDMFNRFRSAVIIEPGWLAWNNGTVKLLAKAAYEERERLSGYLDRARLAVLADAVQEAGCDDEDLVTHLRAEGPHVRGCWALDLLLKKD